MSQLLTANKVNNVWQLSRLNDPRETRADPGYNRSRRGGTGFIRVVRLFLLSFSQGQNFHLNSIRSAQCELSLENINKNPEEKDVMYR